MKEYGVAKTYLDNVVKVDSPPRGSYLNEFVTRANPAEALFQKPATQAEPRSRSPSYMLQRERPLVKDLNGPPQTNFLAEFMYTGPKGNSSPEKAIARKNSPAKSESLLYSPFTAGGDVDSRDSRLSSVKKR